MSAKPTAMKHPDYTLYMVTDAPAAYRRGFLASVEEAVAGGVSIVQYRATEGSRRELYDTGLLLRDLLARLRVPFIINDHVDLALALDADGVHIGQSDLPAHVTRRLIGGEKILGLSVSNRDETLRVDKNVVDYAGLGPVFPTQTKPGAAPATGVADLAALVALSPVPTVAIGGITLERAPAIFASGVDGIAVVTALSLAGDIREAASLLRATKENQTKTSQSPFQKT